MPTYISRQELLAALTGTHETVYESDLFGGRAVLIREITGRQRLLANEAATQENPDAPDNALYRAMLIQMAVVDPDSGVRGPDGAIDPRTRRPLLTVDDVQSIADGRDRAVEQLIDAIGGLSALKPVHLFRRHPAADGDERDAGAGPASGGDADRAVAVVRAAAADGGAALPDGAGAEPGDGARPLE